VKLVKFLDTPINKASVEALNFYVEDMLKIKNKDDALQAYYIFANGIASPQKLL